MDLEKLIELIKARIIEKPGDIGAYNDLHEVLNEPGAKVTDKVWLCDRCETTVLSMISARNAASAGAFAELHKSCLLAAARDNFDAYIQYLEWEREPRKRFYLPRRRVLKRVVDQLQRLADDELDLLTISLPPGTGKSTIALFYLTWMAGKYPDEPMLTGSHSNAFIRGVYDECLRVLAPEGDYLWKDVFPNVSVVNTNAKDCRIDLGKAKRFETLEFTSIGTGNAGLYRAQRLLYCDDLVSGIEVALSKERLDKLWEVYTTDLRQRKQGDHCKELHIATRWSVHDIIGRLEVQYENDPRAEFIVIPALNDEDESNFDYLYGVGFSTETYHKQREIMDEVSWKALYMNQPIEREGLLYHADQLQRYFELPDEEPDMIIAACDTKDRGADYCVMPIAYKYGENYYIEDFLCDNGTPSIVDERLIQILLKHKVHFCRFESNSAGGRTAKTVQDGVKERNGVTKITTKFNLSHKDTRALKASPYVLDHFYFKDESCYTKEYRKAMAMMCSYTLTGKNKHDDVVDALAQLVEYIQSFSTGTVQFIQRPF